MRELESVVMTKNVLETADVLLFPGSGPGDHLEQHYLSSVLYIV